jgi:hypothetical protein
MGSDAACCASLTKDRHIAFDDNVDALRQSFDEVNAAIQQSLTQSDFAL